MGFSEQSRSVRRLSVYRIIKDNMTNYREQN